MLKSAKHNVFLLSYCCFINVLGSSKNDVNINVECSYVNRLANCIC